MTVERIRFPAFGADEKLRLKVDFDRMRENGVKSVSRSLVMVKAPAPDGRFRAGVICGRKFHKRAVRRNRARRLIWEAMRLLRPQMNVERVHLLFIPRIYILNLNEPAVRAEIFKLLSRHGLVQNPSVSGSPPADG